MNMIGSNIVQMFGGCSGYSNFGMGSFGMNGFGNSLFTNCYGEINYDQMAGYGVVNALFGVANQAIASVRADKQKEPDLQTNKASLNKIANDISKKQTEITEKNTELDGLNEKLETAQKSKADFEKELKDLNLDGLKKAWEDAYKEDKNSPATETAYTAYQEAKKKADEIQEKIKTQDKIINNTEEKEIPNCKSAIDELNKDVEKLEAEQKELQAVVDNQAIKKSKSLGYQRADESCVTKWSDKKTCDNDIADKKEIRSAIYKFKKATKKDEKRAAANAIINMYNSNENEFKTQFGDAYKSVKHWLDSDEAKS